MQCQEIVGLCMWMI